MIASYTCTTLDCPDHDALSGFYSKVLGWNVVHRDDNVAYLANDAGLKLGFQKVDNFAAPVWPKGEIPQQFHLDLEAKDLAAAEKELLAAGAVKAEYQPGGDYWIVFLDPAGHPFCIAPPMN